MLSAFQAAPRGPWATALNCLASPWTAWSILIWLGVQALVGLDTAPGQHPAYGVSVRLPAILLPFCVLARWSASGTKKDGLAYVGCALGLLFAFGGTVSAGDTGGYASLGTAAPTERFIIQEAGHQVPVHLGAQVNVVRGKEGVELALRTGNHEVDSGRITHKGGGETQIGPWSFYLRDINSGLEPVYAVLSLTPRAGGASVERTVRVGQAISLPDQTELSVLKLSGDFMSALGPAAQLRLDWAGQGDTSWHFVESPDLDERTGAAPWRVRVLRLDPEPRMTFGVRRAGSFWLAAFGWVLVGVSMFGFSGMRRRA